MVKIMKDPAVREKLSNLGFELMPQIPPPSSAN